MKVTIVGAGNVGSSCAEYILLKEIFDVQTPLITADAIFPVPINPRFILNKLYQ